MWNEQQTPQGVLEAIDALIPPAPATITEHQLLTALHQQGEPGFSEWPSGSDTLSLFRLHFLLFHLLYRLRDQIERRGEGSLAIHCLAIGRSARIAATSSTLPASDDPLRRYYLDLDQLRDTGQLEVDQLLNEFFHRLGRRTERQEALRCLELNENATSDEIRRQYRRLAARHHPDRGGETARLQEINQAMDRLVREPRRDRSVDLT